MSEISNNVLYLWKVWNPCLDTNISQLLFTFEVRIQTYCICILTYVIFEKLLTNIFCLQIFSSCIRTLSPFTKALLIRGNSEVSNIIPITVSIYSYCRGLPGHGIVCVKWLHTICVFYNVGKFVPVNIYPMSCNLYRILNNIIRV